jgi:hypothetical protein
MNPKNNRASKHGETNPTTFSPPHRDAGRRSGAGAFFSRMHGCDHLRTSPLTRTLDGKNEWHISTYPSGFPRETASIPFLYKALRTPESVFFKVFVRDAGKKSGPNPNIHSIRIRSFTYQFPDQEPVNLISDYDHYFWMQESPKHNPGGSAPVPFNEHWRPRMDLRVNSSPQAQGCLLHHDQNPGQGQAECPEGPRRLPLPHEDGLRGPLQVHALEPPARVEQRVQDGILDAFLEARETGTVRHIGSTGHQSRPAHHKMLEESQQRDMKMAASQMPINPADPHFDSFVASVVPKRVAAGVGVLAMKILAHGRFFGGNQGWKRTNVFPEPIIPAVLSVENVFGFVWSLPVATLISGMESPEQVSQNAAMARKTWNWSQAERQKRIDAVAAFAGPNLEFYKN